MLEIPYKIFFFKVRHVTTELSKTLNKSYRKNLKNLQSWKTVCFFFVPSLQFLLLKPQRNFSKKKAKTTLFLRPRIRNKCSKCIICFTKKNLWTILFKYVLHLFTSYCVLLSRKKHPCLTVFSSKCWQKAKQGNAIECCFSCLGTISLWRHPFWRW